MSIRINPRLLVLGVSALGTLGVLRAAVVHAQGPNRPAPLTPLKLRTQHLGRGTVVLFHTKSQAVASRVIAALKGAPGNYVVSTGTPGKAARTVVSHGTLTMAEVSLVQRQVATNLGGGNPAALVVDVFSTLTSLTNIVFSTSITRSQNNTNALDDGISGGDTSTNAENTESDTNISDTDGSDTSTNARNTTNGSDYWDRLRAALQGIDNALYQMDVVDAKSLAQGRFTKVGSITSKGVLLNKSLTFQKGILMNGKAIGSDRLNRMGAGRTPIY